MTKIVTTIGAVLVPGIAAAHPEHFSGEGFGIVHFLTNPFHLGLTFAAILLFIATAHFVHRRHAVNQETQ